MLLKLWTIFTLSILINNPLTAACSSLQIHLDDYSYDLSAVWGTTMGFRVVRGWSPGACNYFLTFSKGSAATFTPRVMNSYLTTREYQVFKDSTQSSILKDLTSPSLSASEVIVGSFVGSSGIKTNNHSYYATMLIPTTLKPAAYYADQVTIRVYQGTLGSSSYTLADSVEMLFQYYEPSNITLSLVPTGGAFNPADNSEYINFGNLVTGDSRSVDAVVVTNHGVKLKFSSFNNGFLKHSTLPDKIPYITRVSGNVVDLSGSASAPVVVATRTGNSPASGFRFPIQFTIGTVSGQGGVYSDNITVTVTSNN